LEQLNTAPRADATRGPAPRDIFSRLENPVVVMDPFPHLVVEDVLPADLAQTLLGEMPAMEVFTRGAAPGSNVRFYLPTAVALADERPSERWKDAIRECNAGMAALLARLMHHLGAHLLATYPDFVARFGPPDALRTIPRAQKGRRMNEVGVDAQMVINTPVVSEATRVRGPHLDRPDKLISGLLYLRTPDDDSVGGELELYAPMRPDTTFNARNETTAENVRFVRKYPYRHNLLVLPLNTPTALHGVSPRQLTSKPRYHVHLVGEMAAPLFAVPKAGG
jgi:hypothetical protein